MAEFMIDEGQLTALKAHAKRLYTERRMDGNAMRDMAHSLSAVVERVQQLQIPEDVAKAAGDSKPLISFEPSDLEQAAQQVEKLRVGFLFDIDNDGSADLVAEQHVLLALSALEQAARYLKIASYTQARANATKTWGTR